MGKKINLTGQRFGRLVAVAPAGKNASGQNLWQLECDCGGTKVATVATLRRGDCNSCGCLIREVRAKNKPRQSKRSSMHGLSRTSEYSSWLGMRRRCLDESYRLYCPGVSIAPEWSDFTRFLADMGPRPSKKHRLERIDPFGDFTPDNCHWTTPKPKRDLRSMEFLNYENSQATQLNWEK